MDILLILLIILYSIVCVFWGMFAIEMQKKEYPEYTKISRLIFVFIANVILCPFSIIYAVCFFEEKNKKY